MFIYNIYIYIKKGERKKYQEKQLKRCFEEETVDAEVILEVVFSEISKPIDSVMSMINCLTINKHQWIVIFN